MNWAKVMVPLGVVTTAITQMAVKMPAKVSESTQEIVTAGLAKLVELVDQWRR